jgi:acylphosphatase
MAENTPHSDEPVVGLVRYCGGVQGVGFRATTASMARQHPVTGCVKNLPDGRVELFVEGNADAVAAFLQAVRSYWKHPIYCEQIEEQPPAGRYRRFDIAR